MWVEESSGGNGDRSADCRGLRGGSDEDIGRDESVAERTKRVAEEAVILRARRKLSAVQAVRVVIVVNGNRVTRAVVPVVMGEARDAE